MTRHSILNRISKVLKNFSGEPFDNLQMVVGEPKDYPECRRTALSRYPKHMLSDPNEYSKFMTPDRQFVRVLEAYSPKGRREVLGHYCIWALNYQLYNALGRGMVVENSIKAEQLLPYHSEHAKALYVMEITSRVGKGDSIAGTLLILDIKSRLIELLTENPHIERVGAWGFSNVGQRMCVQAGLTKREFPGDPRVVNANGDAIDFYDAERRQFSVAIGRSI